ncbi:MAG: aminopeptidase [Chromatiales bacterium]|nr:aminopeptidase [Chromatiales bacterium]
MAAIARYADLERPYPAWNVVATPELALTPQEWCFPFAGCVPYRGYFSQQRARRFAADLQARGLDVRVAPVAAYSTLGWFRDPILASQLRDDDTSLAAVIFHELAHQELYVPGDAAFNESFATAVEIEGVRRWLTARGTPEAFTEYERERARRAAFVSLVFTYRDRLESVYASDASDAGQAGRQGRNPGGAARRVAAVAARNGARMPAMRPGSRRN